MRHDAFPPNQPQTMPVPSPDIPADVFKRASMIRLACFDVDGTLTDGGLTYDHQGNELKTFHVHDGLGFKLLQAAGIDVALVTARRSAASEARARDLGVEAYTHVPDKLACVRTLADTRGIGLDQVAFMGDDLADLTVLRAVGLAVAPANVHPWTAPHVHWTTRQPGGDGAARALCDLLLQAQDKVDGLLQATVGKGAQA